MQVVAEVVLAQAEATWQVALVITSGYAAHKAHLRHVVETHAVQRFVEGETVRILLYAQDTVALERMTGFEYL